MNAKTWLFLLSSFALVAGCADDPAEREWKRQQAQAKRDQKNAVEQCAASMPMFVPGNPPQQAFQVVGPVDGTLGWTLASRFKSMKKQACDLGADAIVDAQEVYVDVGRTRTIVRYDAFGRPYEETFHDPQSARRTTATAVRFVR